MNVYDYIIAGGGAAGLSLAYQMAQTRLRERSILIVDRETKTQSDRTWCFWSHGHTPLDHLIYRSWDQAAVISDTFQEVYDLRPYQYKMMRGIDFYRGMHEALAEIPGITFRQGRVGETGDSKDPGTGQAVIDGEPYGAKYVFDSTFMPKDLIKGPSGHHYLLQHFKSWEIETPGDTFDPHTVMLYDFRIAQRGSLRYFSILPFTKRRARVQYTLVSPQTLKPHEYDREIADYLENVLKTPHYRTEAVETGAVPLSDRPYPRKLGKHVMAIGTKGGCVHPWSGYAFQRIQRDTAAIVSSLVNQGHPFYAPANPGYFRLFDTLMLQLMYRRGDLVKPILIRMFKRNSIQKIFRFLDQECSMSEALELAASLPRRPFIEAFLRVKLLRKV